MTATIKAVVHIVDYTCDSPGCPQTLSVYVDGPGKPGQAAAIKAKAAGWEAGDTHLCPQHNNTVTVAPSMELTTTEVREDVDTVCAAMRDSVSRRTGRTPRVTKQWRDSARLMIDRDNIQVRDILACITWVENHDFWRTNVLSLPTLRKQYDRLSLQAAQQNKRPTITMQLPEQDDAWDAITDDLFTNNAQKEARWLTNS